MCVVPLKIVNWRLNYLSAFKNVVLSGQGGSTEQISYYFFFLSFLLFSASPLSSLLSFFLSVVPVLPLSPYSHILSFLSLCLSQTFINNLTDPRVTLIPRIREEVP